MSERFSYNGNDRFIKAKVIDGIESKIKPKSGYVQPDYVEIEFNEYEKTWKQKNIANQIRETIAILDKKTMRIENEIFYIIHTKAKISELEIVGILKGLKATVLAYLDREKHGLLVSASDKKLHKFLEKDIPLYLQKIHIIRPLVSVEQISESLKQTPDTVQMAIFAIIPNLELEKLWAYLTQLKEFFMKNNCPIYGEELQKYGFIMVDADLEIIQKTTEQSTYIYKVDKVPEATAEEIRSSESNRKVIDILNKPSPIETVLNVPHELPEIVVMDSGVNKVSPLDKVIEVRDSFLFQNLDDEYGETGHGTPVANLLAYGEFGNVPEAKIISYKIISDKEKRFSYNGLMQGIEKYSNRTRLFVNSVGIPALMDNQIVQLDKIIQSKNICFISSAGNIELKDIQTYLQAGSMYPQYISYFPVIPPGIGVNVVSVGSFARTVTKDQFKESLAKPNQISPHSRCGKGDFDLYDCKKPEVVEHGGNVNSDNQFKLDTLEVGVRTIDMNGKGITSLSGTSFSAPIFARRLCEIERRYKDNMRNSETLLSVAYMSCENNFERCGGYGSPSSFVGCGKDSALYIAEGQFGFPAVKDDKITTPYNDIMIYVPPDVNEIKICLVHSDDFKKAVRPTLETYLEVKATKLGNNSAIPPWNKSDEKNKTNVKILTYRFDSKSMESIWTFNIRPKTTSNILSTDRRSMSVRYGCSILLKGKPDRQSKETLTAEIIEKRNRFSL